jgi:hypothetical protein
MEEIHSVFEIIPDLLKVLLPMFICLTAYEGEDMDASTVILSF